MSTDSQRTIPWPDDIARLPQLCFTVASLTALGGVSLGIYMGVSQDHQLAPVHVHLNVLGWVSLFLMGLYYKTHEGARGLAALVQVSVFAAGYLVMMAGAAGMILSDYKTYLPLAIAGSLMVWTGFAMFAAIVAFTRDAPRPRG